MAMGTDGNTDATPEQSAPAAEPVRETREVIASPSRRADGSVTHGADAEIPDPDGYAEQAARQIAGMADVDADRALELARAEAARGGQVVETR